MEKEINKAQKSANKDIRKIGKLIKDIKVAMLTTVSSDGRLYSRPMIAQEIEFDGDLWFFTKRSSDKVSSIKRNEHVNITYADPENNKYVSVSGIANVVSDRPKTQQLWTTAAQAWFPGGINDPDLALIWVDVERAEYWDSHINGMVRLLDRATTYITGRKRKEKFLDHKKIDLAH